MCTNIIIKGGVQCSTELSSIFLGRHFCLNQTSFSLLAAYRSLQLHLVNPNIKTVSKEKGS